MMNKTPEPSALSEFMKEMKISSTKFQIVADNPRSKSLWPYSKKSFHTADADKESLRWLATANGSHFSDNFRASSFDGIFPTTPTKFSKSPLTRSASDLVNSPPCLPRRRESYDADENTVVSPPLSKKFMEVVTMASPKISADKKPMKARAA
jgi:hypothetical protein